jgi:hypothetical protein
MEKTRSAQVPSQQANFIMRCLIFLVSEHGFFFVIFLAHRILGWPLDFLYFCALYTNLHGIIFQNPVIFKFSNTRASKSQTNILVMDRSFRACPHFVTDFSSEFRFMYPRLLAKGNTGKYHYGFWMNFTRPSSDPPSSQGISVGGGNGDSKEHVWNIIYRKQPR